MRKEKYERKSLIRTWLLVVGYQLIAMTVSLAYTKFQHSELTIGIFLVLICNTSMTWYWYLEGPHKGIDTLLYHIVPMGTAIQIILLGLYIELPVMAYVQLSGMTFGLLEALNGITVLFIPKLLDEPKNETEQTGTEP